MIAINGYYNGCEYVSLENADVQPYQKVIITILNEFIDKKEAGDKPFLKYVGKLNDESFSEISEVLKDCKKVDINEW